jgi:protein tyrosine phosphatase (PTP) superfamily phosphohydrolase (DUF442 family)
MPPDAVSRGSQPVNSPEPQPEPQPQPEHAEEPLPPPPDVAASDAELEEPSVPRALSGSSLVRRGAARWAIMGTFRWLYRVWTRIAAHVFPEDSPQAVVAARLGIPLPDRLNMSWVTSSLAVGGRVLPQDIHRLARAGITRVVDTRSEHKDDEAALQAEGIQLLYLPTPDTTPLSLEQLREGTAWVNRQIKNGQRVLIHCEHGVGRSVLLTAATLVCQGMNAHEAISTVQRHRWQAAPNHWQVRRLQEFEREVHRQPTGAL